MNDLFDMPTQQYDTPDALRAGSCQLLLPSIYGFCGGVRRALRILDSTIRQHSDRPAWLLGQIIHNGTVNDYFCDQGVQIIPESELERVFDLASPSDTLILPAFGLPLDMDARVRRFCAGKGHVVDTTCRYVKRAWDFVSHAAADRQTVLFHGKPNHPETRATMSRAATCNNAAVLIPDPAAAEEWIHAINSGSQCFPDHARYVVRNPQQLDPQRLAIAYQTTMLHEDTQAVRAIVTAAIESNSGTVVIAETLCNATQDRQDAALELCRQGCDLILVIGGYASSNTTQLYRLATRHAPAYFVKDARALGATHITHYLPDRNTETSTSAWLTPTPRSIGILAGASCPPSDIDGAIRQLKQIMI